MATKPSMRFISTTSDKLANIEIKAGQLIFCSDIRVIYLDTDVRTSYQAIINVVNEATRAAIVSPIEGYYYVREENTLWSYFGEWVQITGQNSSLIFVDGSLPQQGRENVIYVKDDEMYRYDADLNDYYQITGGNKWEDYLNNEPV